MKCNRYIFIIYDSVNNAVFQSQVIGPIEKRIKENPDQEWLIISFEKRPFPTYRHSHIAMHYFKRYPFIGCLSLLPLVYQLRTFLLAQGEYHLIARGPFAGYIAQHGKTSGCRSLLVQARGLAGQEYEFAHQPLNFLHKIRISMLERLEQSVYGSNQNFTIESVSTALRDYLIERFNANAKHIILARHDIPAVLPNTERQIYRHAIRSRFNIHTNITVYCYNGSYKPWQCPTQTLLLFKQRYTHKANCFLLILTPDITPFKQCAELLGLPQESYIIFTVTAEELMHYLAASDIGILLREPHIINQVSRPTKAMEYHAAGLTVLHNGTVAYLKEIVGLRQQFVSLQDIY